MNVAINARMEALAVVVPRVLIKTVAATGTPERLTRRNVSSATYDGVTTVTVTTSAAHDFLSGDLVSHSGFNQSAYNIRAEITVTSTTVYTYQIPPQTVPPAQPTGTAFADGELFCRRALLLGYKAATTLNTTAVRVGPTSGDGTQTFEIPVGGEAELPSVAGAKHNLKDHFVDVGTNGDGLVIYLY